MGREAPGNETGTGRGPAWESGDAWALGLLLLAQAGLMAAVFMAVPHTGGDNAGYLGLAYSLLERGAYLDLYLPAEPAHTKYPPVFPGLLALAHLAGVKTWAGFKAVSAGSTALAVGFTFLWARVRRGRGFAVAVAGLTALSGAVLYYSHWILSDPTFLALTIGALWMLERSESDAPPKAVRASGPAGPWLAAGAATALLAYFTRSAGLPLVVAVLGWLALRRRWLGLAAFGGAFGAAAGGWWLRNRAVSEEGAYLSEFWLVNPYQPELGRAGPLDLVARVGENLVGYVTAHIPGGITGLGGPAAGILGVGLVVLAGWGWFERARERVGVAELFLPLYAGLLLVWPVVWSGDRFALPLFPLLILYAGVALADGVGRRSRSAAVAGLAVGVLLLGGPAAQSWTESMERALACASRARADGPWACAGPRMLEFAAAAGWSGSHLPEGSVVVSRKPRFFFLLSGLRSEMYPLERDPGVFLRRARELGAGYLVFDYLDGLAGSYLVPILRRRPEAFCSLRDLSDVGGVGTRLLGIVPDAPSSGGGRSGEAVRLRACPDGLLRAEARSGEGFYASSTVPLFSRASP